MNIVSIRDGSLNSIGGIVRNPVQNFIHLTAVTVAIHALSNFSKVMGMDST